MHNYGLTLARLSLCRELLFIFTGASGGSSGPTSMAASSSVKDAGRPWRQPASKLTRFFALGDASGERNADRRWAGNVIASGSLLHALEEKKESKFQALSGDARDVAGEESFELGLESAASDL
mmetsp:Transcript_109636/g.317026  ORF Transcript_109636/g.317026 Transcript_109636/m.317026 type:complete len:123 (+) Transcript_109636:133-501(+)